ncbi:inositol monophosphatase family protein [Companilactobacillus sp. DQM5]|uniref:inositol monophosphatase family protein n=1 Tax=Companilactobacillus sp. DQM5 TaxID=3463359 RepID=UPI004059D922
MNIEKLTIDIKNILNDVSEILKDSMEDELIISTKSNKNDLVTNMDKKIEKFIIERIKTNYPNAQIFSEEGFGDSINNLSGLIFFVDPIDGTLNYVKERKDFASMIGVYFDGKPILGAIMDIMANKLYIGGPETGVFCNEKKLRTPENRSLNDSLITISSRLTFNEEINMKKIIQQSSGLRVLGSAGIIYGRMLEDRQNAYISKLAPWDLAAGKILLETLNFNIVGIDGKPINMLKSQPVIIGTKQLTQEVLNILN